MIFSALQKNALTGRFFKKKIAAFCDQSEESIRRHFRRNIERPYEIEKLILTINSLTIISLERR